MLKSIRGEALAHKQLVIAAIAISGLLVVIPALQLVLIEADALISFRIRDRVSVDVGPYGNVLVNVGDRIQVGISPPVFTTGQGSFSGFLGQFFP